MFVNDRGITTISDDIQNNSVSIYVLYTALEGNAYILSELYDRVVDLEKKLDHLQHQINDIQLNNNHIPMHY